MKVIRDLEECPSPPGGCVVTMGNYDGVHRGHRSVIHELQARAAKVEAATALVTYVPHTLAVIRPDRAPKLLTTTDRKLELLGEAGLDYVALVTFDEARSHQPAEDFVAEVLAGCLHAREVVVGADTRFGHKARGDLALLEALGPQYGFSAQHLDLVVTDGDEKVSSSRIRRALEGGSVEWARWALERPHEVSGPVVVGDRRGRELGFPTANLDVPLEICVPGDGVYAGWCRLGDRRLPAAINVGKRPQFYESADRSLVEAHLLDFAEDIYGHELTVEFWHFLRPETRFETVEDLIEQIDADCEVARQLLTDN